MNIRFKPEKIKTTNFQLDTNTHVRRYMEHMEHHVYFTVKTQLLIFFKYLSIINLSRTY